MPTTAPRANESAAHEAKRARRRRIAAAKQSLRELRIELAVLNHRIGSRIEIRDIDFDCLDIITRHGPISPTALARRVGVHLATMTGILARLEGGGWIVRDRVENDRRAVVVRAVRDKQRDIVRLCDDMNSSLDEILEGYSDDQIDLVVEFLRRCTQAGQHSADRLAEKLDGSGDARQPARSNS
jgi:DNA-binding MarR family transcriptional regulator